MLGPVNVYPIWYGNWGSSGVDLAIQTLVPAFIQDLSDSAYSATLLNYLDNSGGPSGTFVIHPGVLDNPGMQGSVLLHSFSNPEPGAPYDDGVQDEVQELILQKRLPNDINGVYLLLPHSDDVVQTTPDGFTRLNYCIAPYPTGFCGFNDDYPLAGTKNIKFVVVPEEDPNTCQNCQYNFPSPNQAEGLDENGQIDFMLSTIARELFNAVTSPDKRDGNGWYVSAGQEADFCSNTVTGAPNLGITYTSGLTGAPANMRLNGMDLLLQPQRAMGNNGNGAVGYCVNNYGGSFWGRQFGLSWSPIGDWSTGHYKGECQ